MGYLKSFKYALVSILIMVGLFAGSSYADLPAHCLAGNAAYSGDLPTWSEVESNNTGYIEQNPSSEVVGVPDLENIGDEFPLSDSITNSVNLVSNLLNAKVLPTVASKVIDPGTVGVGICQTGPEVNGKIPVDITMPLTFCEFATDYCPGNAEDRILWIPQSADFLERLVVDIGPQEVDLFEQLGNISSGVGLPANLSFSGTAEQPTISAEIPVDFSEASKKWTKKVVDFLDSVFSMSLADILGPNASSALSNLKKKSGELTDAIDNFTKQVNLYGEGYHLGAMDRTRPKLHSCVGYYGHGVKSQLTSLLNGRITLSSRYKSQEISKDYKAQARLGVTELELFGKQLVLMAAPEANIQFDSLSSFDCVAPFGIPMYRSPNSIVQNGLCAVNIPGAFPQVCNADEDKEEYAAIPQTSPSSSGTAISGMVDYYPINVGNGVEWPRFGQTPININGENPAEYLYVKNNLLHFDNEDDINTIDVNEGEPQTDINHSVLSAGLNWAYEGGFEEPKVLLTMGPFAPTPITAELRLDLDWGLSWFHDSYYMRDRLKGGAGAIQRRHKY